MSLIVALFVMLLLCGLVYLWWRYFRKTKPNTAVPRQAIQSIDKIEPQPAPDQQLELTEADVANINRIPELITTIESLALAVRKNSSKEISLEEALSRISSTTLMATPEQLAELKNLMPSFEDSNEPKVQASKSLADKRVAAMLEGRKKAQEKRKQEKLNANSVREPELKN